MQRFALKPSNFPYCDIKWTFQGENIPRYMIDTRLMFGNKLARSIFHGLTQSIRRITRKRHNVEVVAYLDDVFIACPSYDECNNNMHRLISLLRQLDLV